MNFTLDFYQIQNLFINIHKTLFFFLIMGKGRRESCTYKDCIKKILQKKGVLWKNNGTVSRIVRRKFLEHKLFSKLWFVRNVWNFIKKKKRKKRKMKYCRIGQIVYSHFSIENWKVKMLETITTHINIEKPNEMVIKHAFYLILLKIKFYKDVI